MISGLHHYALEVPDLAVAEGFLQDFGLETGEKDGSLVAMCPGRQQEQVRMVQAPAKRLHVGVAGVGLGGVGQAGGDAACGRSAWVSARNYGFIVFLRAMNGPPCGSRLPQFVNIHPICKG